MWLLLACADPRPNVLLVSMDTVRFDHTSLGGNRDTTPNLARLAAAGATWPDAWAVGNESIYSHAAILTGRYPSEVAIPDYGSYAIPASIPTLASVLRAYGYHTGAFTGGGHILADFGFDNGFDVFRTATGDTRAGSFFSSVPAALQWIDQQDTPWFVFVHGYDAHSPYVQPGPFRHLWGADGIDARMDTIAADPLAIEQLRGDHWFADRAPKDFLHAAGPRLLGLEVYTTPAAPRPGERDITLTAAEITHLRDHYDTGVTYADVWLGLLLAHVDLDDTLVIVLSDHGEDLLDHGFVNHRTGLWDSTLHVPLVVAGPGFAGTGVHPHRVDLRSVLPTVLRATGATLPAGVTAPALQDDPDETTVFAEGVMDMVSARGPAARLVLSDAKLAANTPDLATRSLTDGRAALYIEPAPVDTVASSAEGEALRAQIVAWRKSLNPATTTGAPVSEAIRAALRERGYWSPGEAPTP